MNAGIDVVWLAIAGFVLTIAFFGSELLIKCASRKIIFGVSFALCMTAVFPTILMRNTPTLFPSLINPTCFTRPFLLMRKLFVRWKHRQPIDTFDWRSGLAADRLNFWVICGWICG